MDEHSDTTFRKKRGRGDESDRTTSSSSSSAAPTSSSSLINDNDDDDDDFRQQRRRNAKRIRLSTDRPRQHFDDDQEDEIEDCCYDGLVAIGRAAEFVLGRSGSTTKTGSVPPLRPTVSSSSSSSDSSGDDDDVEKDLCSDVDDHSVEGPHNNNLNEGLCNKMIAGEQDEEENDDSDSSSDTDNHRIRQHRVTFAPALTISRTTSIALDNDGDNDDDVNEETPPPPPVLTHVGPAAKHFRPTKQECWWTRNDRCSFLEDSRIALDDFQEEHEDQVLEFHRIQSQCFHTAAKATMVKATTKDDGHRPTGTVDNYCCFESSGLPPLVIPVDIRGLEWGLSHVDYDGGGDDNPSTLTRRKLHTDKVLDLQEDLLSRPCPQEKEDSISDEDSDSGNDDCQSTVTAKRKKQNYQDISLSLRRCSEESSLGDRLYARLIGKGDEIQAGQGTNVDKRTMVPGLLSTLSSCRHSPPRPQHQHIRKYGLSRLQQPVQLFRSRCTIMPHY